MANVGGNIWLPFVGVCGDLMLGDSMLESQPTLFIVEGGGEHIWPFNEHKNIHFEVQ